MIKNRVRIKPNTFCIATGKPISTVCNYEIKEQHKMYLVITNGYSTYVIKRSDIVCKE